MKIYNIKLKNFLLCNFQVLGKGLLRVFRLNERKEAHRYKTHARASVAHAFVDVLLTSDSLSERNDEGVQRVLADSVADAIFGLHSHCFAI